MSNQYNHARKDYRARYNKVRAAAFHLNSLMSVDPDKLEGVAISDMRDEVEMITQCFHEFSAYWNAANSAKAALKLARGEQVKS